MRLFVGLPIPVGPYAELTQRLAHLPTFRAVPAGSWHITLRFLGEVFDIPAMELALAGAARDRIAIPCVVEGVGAFPNAKRARVLWAAVRAPGIDALAAAVVAATARFGEPPETRPFVAHATLARLARPADVRHLVHAEANTLLAQGRLDRIVLYNSVTTQHGPRYEAVRTFPLGLRSSS